MEIYNLGDRIMNTWLYPIADGYVMIDTGYEHSFKEVMKRMEKQGITPEQIRFLFLTHAHDDHAGFLRELMQTWPHIQIVAHPKAIDGLRKGQNSFEGGCSGLMAFAFCQVMTLLGKGTHRYPALSEDLLARIVTLHEDNIPNLESKLGGQILFTPGHTADSVSLLVDGNLFCGDAAMNGIPSSHKITIWVENKEQFGQSWDVMLASGAKKIYPAHGRTFCPGKLADNQKYIAGLCLRSLEGKG